MSERRFAAAVTVLAGAGMVVFTFLPWLRFLPPSTSPGLAQVVESGWGLRDSGVDLSVWTIVLGGVLVVSGLALFFGVMEQPFAGISAAAAVIALAGVCFFLSNPRIAFDPAPDFPYPHAFEMAAWGLWCIFGFALLGVIATLTAVVASRRVDLPTAAEHASV
ncbi:MULTISPECIES: hypothetical protein [unclassified Gordonia (in: high G+C Gram-positive bacteria)]|uniref:hypothetical protein n=1 Tax=unclassified Gordonia (in: high G+C Gram-positive bacteria) TaxID=2657482 RepID=UPI001FFEF14A|nr:MULTISPECIES: hypothetical protein [unclassified Gordonia (in: high G+C Gram-positive bacteria)]UQE75626.1 hypothetical protein MYK68_03120 [Gordonia sp. PP30]